MAAAWERKQPEGCYEDGRPIFRGLFIVAFLLDFRGDWQRRKSFLTDSPISKQATGKR